MSCTVPSVISKRLHAMLIKKKNMHQWMYVCIPSVWNYHLSEIRVFGKEVSTVQGTVWIRLTKAAVAAELLNPIGNLISYSCVLSSQIEHFKTPHYFDGTLSVLFSNHLKFFGNAIDHSSMFHIIVKDLLHLVLLPSILWCLLRSSNSL